MVAGHPKEGEFSMARYLGPKSKLSSREGRDLLLESLLLGPKYLAILNSPSFGWPATIMRYRSDVSYLCNL
jgi:hypothetical protein